MDGKKLNLNFDRLKEIQLNRNDYIKKQVHNKATHIICHDCDLWDMINGRCRVEDDKKFQCWNDDTVNGNVQQFIFIKK